jgi:hypothetical protein
MRRIADRIGKHRAIRRPDGKCNDNGIGHAVP